MPDAVMLDTNIYSGGYRDQVSRIGSLYVSSVVIQELLVIANRRMQRALISDFTEQLNNGTGIVPNYMDWLEVGKCLARLHQDGMLKFGKLSKGEVNMLFRDALLARTAMRVNSILITANMNDFIKIKSVFRSLKVRSPSEYFALRGR